MEFVKTDSEEVFTSYADREVRLVILKMKVDSSNEMESNSYILNLHRDNDVKLQVARTNMDEVRKATEIHGFGDLSKLQSGKRSRVDKSAAQEIELDDEYTTTLVLTMEAILKKESPGDVLNVYEAADDLSSFFKKRDVKEKKKANAMNTSEIKKAVHDIIKNGAKTGKTSGKRTGKRSGSRSSLTKRSVGKKSSGSKKMTISSFKQYIGWYDKQAREGKLSIAPRKASLKKSSVSKRSRSK